MRLPGLDPRFVAQFAPRALAPRSAPGLAVDLGDEDLAALADDTFAAAMREPTGRAPDSVTVQRIGPEDVTPAARGYADIPGAWIGSSPAHFRGADPSNHGFAAPPVSPDAAAAVEAFAAEEGMSFDDEAAAFDGTQEPPAVAAEPPPPIAPAAMATGGTIPAPTTPTGAPAPVAAPSGPAVPGLAAAAPVAPSVAVPGLHGLWDPAQVAPGQTPPGVAPRAVDPTPGPEQAKAASTYRGPAFLTAQEKEQLATAEQRDRRMRIAQGALGGLGGLVGLIGAARGTGAAEFGTGLMSAAGAIPAGAATARVNDRIGERRALELANLQREDAAAAAAATSTRQAEELALRRRAVEAQAARDEAAAAEDAAQAQIARDMAEAEQASLPSLRATFRAAIESVVLANPQAAPYMSLVESGALDSMSRTDLLQGLQRLMGDRFEFRGVSGTGGLGAPPSEWTRDAAGNLVEVRAPRPGGAAPMARIGGGGGRHPLPPAQPAAGGETVALDTGGDVDRVRRLLILEGYEPGSEEFNLQQDVWLSRLAAGGPEERTARADLHARVGRAADASVSGLPARWGAEERSEYARIDAAARPVYAAARSAESAYRDLNALRRAHPDAWNVALIGTGNPSIPLPAEAQRIRAQILEILSERLHDLSGAAVSVPEFDRIRASLGVGGSFVWSGAPDTLLQTLRRGIERAHEGVEDIVRGSQYPSVTTHWTSTHYGRGGAR